MVQFFRKNSDKIGRIVDGICLTCNERPKEILLYKGWTYGYCKKCWYEYQKDRYINNLESIRFRKLNITKDEYIKLLEQCDYTCVICGYKFINPLRINKTKKERVDVHPDHNHLTGKIRGVLCKHCNNGLGSFKDNINALEKAIIYLKKYN